MNLFNANSLALINAVVVIVLFAQVISISATSNQSIERRIARIQIIQNEQEPGPIRFIGTIRLHNGTAARMIKSNTNGKVDLTVFTSPTIDSSFCIFGIQRKDGGWFFMQPAQNKIHFIKNNVPTEVNLHDPRTFQYYFSSSRKHWIIKHVATNAYLVGRQRQLTTTSHSDFASDFFMHLLNTNEV